MAQIANVGQGLHATLGPLTASTIIFLGLIFALLCIKIWGFKRRLTFESRVETAPSTAQLTPPPSSRQTRGSLQVNGTDNAIHGIFRRRNVEEIESVHASAHTPPVKYIAGSVPNLRLATELLSQDGFIEVTTANVASEPQIQEPKAPRRRRREVHSSSFEYYAMPPTRKPPTPPVPEADPPPGLDVPNFDHFAEKYKLFTAKTTSDEFNVPQGANKDIGGYMKYERVDDDLVPEPLTPEVEPTAVSVSAIVHSNFNSYPDREEEEPALPNTDTSHNSLPINIDDLEDEQIDSAYIENIFSNSSNTPAESSVQPDLFSHLEIPSALSSINDTNFQRIRSSYEMNEADLLDIQPDLDQPPMPGPHSPPGFGKTIDEDWENFENLQDVEGPDPNWALHPNTINTLEQVPYVVETLNNGTLTLGNVPEIENLFEELELIEPLQQTVESEQREIRPPPPSYASSSPALPDYESLMQEESMKASYSLPKYADVVGGNNNNTKYISSIDDLYAEIGESNVETNLHDFEELCEELEVITVPSIPPLPAPRLRNTSMFNDHGLSGSSNSNAAIGTIGAIAAPRPAKRNARALKVRFDIENLQYYQSAELPSSSESDDPDSYMVTPPTPMLRLSVGDSSESLAENKKASIFIGSQASQTDSDTDEFGPERTANSDHAVQQHCLMTEVPEREIRSDFEVERGSELGAVPKRQAIKLKHSLHTDTEA
ncbi:uncharacterized protein LOC115623287 [Scaptodrosophila lebanonensis]|uniref:Uncharacterized protein LOC115623287 n=1 Tax=Drosophila lebanonensis TaxID=7225 RepID=A0A6J2T989_DROLE|nr:uncharacterized protein LOC115623287 [Scaptodrosophila lebanonensis]